MEDGVDYLGGESRGGNAASGGCGVRGHYFGKDVEVEFGVKIDVDVSLVLLDGQMFLC